MPGSAHGWTCDSPPGSRRDGAPHPGDSPPGEGLQCLLHMLTDEAVRRRVRGCRTASRRPVTPLPAPRRSRQRRHKEISAERADLAHWAPLPDQPADLVFTTKTGRPIDPRSINDLRHTCATLLLHEGASEREVMELLGHSSINITVNTYAHVLGRRQAQARRPHRRSVRAHKCPWLMSAAACGSSHAADPLLRRQDSNLDHRNQNPRCCRYTTADRPSSWHAVGTD
jgi:Phage integrase family